MMGTRIKRTVFPRRRFRARVALGQVDRKSTRAASRMLMAKADRRARVRVRDNLLETMAVCPGPTATLRATLSKDLMVRRDRRVGVNRTVSTRVDREAGAPAAVLSPLPAQGPLVARASQTQTVAHSRAMETEVKARELRRDLEREIKEPL